MSTGSALHAAGLSRCLAGIVRAPPGQKVLLVFYLFGYGIAESGETVFVGSVRINGAVGGVCEESHVELLSGPEDGGVEVVCAVIPDSLFIADVKRSVTAVSPLATIGVCSHSEASAGISEIIVVNHSAPGFGKGRGGLVRCMVEGMKIKLLPSLCITELAEAGLMENQLSVSTLGAKTMAQASGSWRGTISILAHEAAPESNSAIVKAARERP